MNQARKEPLDARDILDKAMLATDRLEALVDVVYRLVLEADGSCSTQGEMKKKIQTAIPLFEYLELDIKRVEGALRGAYDCIHRHRTENQTPAGRQGVAA